MMKLILRIKLFHKKCILTYHKYKYLAKIIETYSLIINNLNLC